MILCSPYAVQLLPVQVCRHSYMDAPALGKHESSSPVLPFTSTTFWIALTVAIQFLMIVFFFSLHPPPSHLQLAEVSEMPTDSPVGPAQVHGLNVNYVSAGPAGALRHAGALPDSRAGTPAHAAL